jgi:cytochrome c553
MVFEEVSEMKRALISSGLVGLVLATVGVGAFGEESQGLSPEELFQFHGCINCHGADGKAPVSKVVPKLAGKPADELYDKATKILSGEGATEEAKLMHAAFYAASNCNAPPTDEHVKSITAWLATK